MSEDLSHQPLSVRDVDANLPDEILERLRIRFYHAQQEFDKIKKHQVELEEKRGHKCPWAKKISEDTWVRRTRKQWTENPPQDGEKSRRGPKGWGFVTMLKIWIYASLFGAEQNAAPPLRGRGGGSAPDKSERLRKRERMLRENLTATEQPNYSEAPPTLTLPRKGGGDRFL